MITLRPVQAEDADALFPLVYNTAVTDTLIWDGPQSLEELRAALAIRSGQVARGESFAFTIWETASNRPIGSCSIRPNPEKFRGELGIWIGEPYQGKGYGRRAVRLLVNHGFGRLDLEKLDAYVYTGNHASRHIFEKSGFLLEATIRKAVRKRGVLQDDWLFGMIREEWLRSLIVHICTPGELEAVRAVGAAGQYAPASMHAVGFIHFSRPDQVEGVVGRYYSQVANLGLLWVDPSLLNAELRYEASDGDSFPHLYGPLNLPALVMVTDIAGSAIA